MWLFIPFLVVPLIEIALFVQIGGWIGLWPTLTIVVLTALAGTVLVRSQGLSVLGQLQNSLREAGDPTGPIAHGAMILFAGALLLTPGFFTDICGFALLVPAVRSKLMEVGAKHLASRITVVGSAQTTARPDPESEPIDADYAEIDVEIDLEDGPRGSSGWTQRN